MHPTVEVSVLSHAKSLALVMVHIFHLMPVVQMNQLLVRVLLCVSARDAPPAISGVAAAHPFPVGVTLVLSRVSPLAHATPSLLLPFSSYPFSFAGFAYHVAASLPE